ncbi:DinB family protein [Saccharothrix violaceirubra]|uniref:Putative damage-inducible protein DinB n=1 Tax=Saccharothrix violaceirubra TaxID=413306 RepID=A0A7W7WXK1_9PSEU|nr:DinB family protein [Saccharothrix violaceirubra]MBB4967202.1 putative damage-inducible protein DinB [Saccharothrix violaceirubra]
MSEKTDLIAMLARQRGFLRHTAQALTDEQAASRPTVSQLCIGGLIKHVRGVEESWLRFAVGGAELMNAGWEGQNWEDQHRMLPGETLDGLLEDYEETATKTEAIIATLDLDDEHPLPEAPWFPPGAKWSNRFVLQHVIAETSQHAGHADIIRESIDGQKTMG